MGPSWRLDVLVGWKVPEDEESPRKEVKRCETFDERAAWADVGDTFPLALATLSS